jgi:uncharacterized C2H2 Zn-finger protein
MPSDEADGALNIVRCPRCRRLGALRKGARGLVYVEHVHDLGDGKIALSRCYLGRSRGGGDGRARR